MPIPSLYQATNGPRTWSVARAAAYGGGVGGFAALFKTFGPLHGADPAPGAVWQILAAAVAFALLCAGAAALRNFVAGRLIWHDCDPR
jgi:hypothetical protein